MKAWLREQWESGKQLNQPVATFYVLGTIYGFLTGFFFRGLL